MLALGVILIAGLLLTAYRNSFQVPFLLDDDDSISKNPSIRSLATALFPPADSGITVSGRPLLNLSFALNQQLGGPGVRGYHIGNLLIHFAATLCLFGILRRSFRLPSLAERFGKHDVPLALLVSLLWALHPLQTESVTYIVQRAESLVGLCYLLTLYAFIRSVEKPSRLWPLLTCLACALGMAAKEVMATAPLMILLYDRCFISGDFRESWRQRRGFYSALAASWLLLLALVVSSGGRGKTVGFAAVNWLDYALTQGWGITCYLFHALVPINLVFDYGAIVEKQPLQVVGGLAIIASLLTSTWVLLRKFPTAGFLGAWFFGILAPSSSIIPIATQMLAEHRMYLPLAAVILAGVLLIYQIRTWLAWSILPLLALAACFGTYDRNRDYSSALTLWEDTVRKVPDNARALNNVGNFYRDADRLEDAIRSFSEAIRLAPSYGFAISNLGQTYMKKGLHKATDGGIQVGSGEFAPDDAAIQQGLALLRKAVELDPNNALFCSNYGTALQEVGRLEESLPLLEKALNLDPKEASHAFNYANCLSDLNQYEEAERHYTEALRLTPEDPEILTNYGILLRRLNRFPDSIQTLQTAARLKPDSARIRSNLGVSLLASGSRDAGIRELNTALQLNPRLPQIRYHLGNALAAMGRTEEAITHLEALLTLARPSAEVLSNLGVLYAQVGRLDEATARLHRALELDPKHSAARENLERILAFQKSQKGQ